MKLIKQKNSTTCGQSCVAMILGITLNEAIHLIGHDGVTNDFEITTALGIDDVLDNIFKLGKPPKHGLFLQKHRNPAKKHQEHWTVLKNGVLFDPACIGNDIWPVYKYLEIK